RPLHLEAIAREARWIEIALQRPGGDNLAAFLGDVAERHKLAFDVGTGLLREFAPGDRERILAFRIFAFGDRPGAEILLGPERPTRMHQQQLDGIARLAIKQDAGAALGHRRYSRLLRAIVRVPSRGTSASACARKASAARAAGRSRQRASQSPMRGVAERSISMARLMTAATLRLSTGNHTHRR